MKTIGNVLLLLILFVSGPAVALVKLCNPSRHVVVQVRREHGAVVINSKKIRVPYTMQETAVPTQADGLTEYLFLGNEQLCLVTAFLEFVMGLCLVLMYHVNTVESGLRKYRPMILKTLFLSLVAFAGSEFISHYVNNGWLIDVKNGVNGNDGLFGINATFPNAGEVQMNLDYQVKPYLFMIPLVALVVLERNRRFRERAEA